MPVCTSVKYKEQDKQESIANCVTVLIIFVLPEPDEAWDLENDPHREVISPLSFFSYMLTYS